MKTITKILAATGFALAAVSGSAMARPHFGIGLSIGVPAPYYAPRPYYYPPAPYYAAPAYYGSPYYAPAPVYGPAVVYGGYGGGYYGPHRGYYGHRGWRR
jgi:hypothetical protein